MVTSDLFASVQLTPSILSDTNMIVKRDLAVCKSDCKFSSAQIKRLRADNYRKESSLTETLEMEEYY